MISGSASFIFRERENFVCWSSSAPHIAPRKASMASERTNERTNEIPSRRHPGRQRRRRHRLLCVSKRGGTDDHLRRTLCRHSTMQTLKPVVAHPQSTFNRPSRPKERERETLRLCRCRRRIRTHNWSYCVLLFSSLPSVKALCVYIFFFLNYRSISRRRSQ